ncbi:MAG: 3-hydroxyacyl-CoA dehydrogenase family protein [Chitinophagaceae bacterium]
MQIETIAVCGAGTMGSGIAQLCAQNNFKTIVFDVQESVLQKSKQQIQTQIFALVNKQKISTTEANSILENLVFTTEINDCKADVVIEAIVEQLEIKQQLFEKLAIINHSQTILATNTSSISVTAIANNIVNPERVVGMHFFNPAPLMKLVEIIETPCTNSVYVQKLLLLANRLNKVAVVCKDAPGFIVNRVARHYYLEAMRLVENNHASIKNVDDMMETLGFKMGPFKLMDLIGLDINLNVSKIVYEQLGKPERLRPSFLQQQKVNENKLGRKTDEGFYIY